MKSEKLAQVSNGSLVTRSEANMARSELQQMFHPTVSDMPGVGDVQQLIGAMKAAWDRQDPMVSKGIGLTYGGPSAGGANNTQNYLVSTGTLDVKKDKQDKSRSIFVDERGVFGTVPGGFKRRPSMFGAEHLRMMVENTPVINSIILRRDRTIKRFLRPSERNRDLKFEVCRADQLGHVRAKKGKEEAKLESFLVHSGWEEHPGRMQRMNRDHIPAFITKSLRDILTLDAWAIETIPTRNNKCLDGYHAVDAATIFLASEQGYMGDDEVIAVQVVNGLPYTVYTVDELAYKIQNPRTDVLHHGYGYAPPEMIVKIITGYLNALTFNLKGFDSNAIPKGLLNIYGDYDENELEFFKSQWNAMIRGVNNSWALPVMVSPDKNMGATWTKFGVEWSDMYFAKWMVLLVSIVCGVYGMDPTEIYSESFSAGKSSLSGKDTAERLAEARDTGLEPLMSFIEDVFTYNILHRVGGSDYVFRFSGIQPSDQEWKHEVQKLVMTIGQLAEENGIDATNAEWADAPVNPSLQAAYMQGLQDQKQDERMGPEDEIQGGFGDKDGQESGMTESGQRADRRTHKENALEEQDAPRDMRKAYTEMKKRNDVFVIR